MGNHDSYSDSHKSATGDRLIRIEALFFGERFRAGASGHGSGITGILGKINRSLA